MNRRGLTLILCFGMTLATSISGIETYVDLKNTIREKNIRSVDDLLKHLSETGSPFLEQATLMHHSRNQFEPKRRRSNRVATAQFPNVILYHGDLVLYFSGNPKKKDAWNNLDIIEYSKDQARFHFRKINFAKNKPTYFDKPKDCRSCHGSPARPLWGSYALWSGAYGGHQDHIPSTSRKRVAFLKFIRKTLPQGRYQHLKYPGRNSEQIVSLPETKGIRLAHEPNLRFSRYLSRLNYHRISSKINESKRLKQFQYAIAGALLNCSHTIRDFLPPKVRAKMRRRAGTYSKILNQTRKKMARHFQRRASHYNRLSGLRLEISPYRKQHDTLYHQDIKDASRVAKLRFLLEGQGVSMRNWSLSYEPRSYSYSFASSDRGVRDLLNYLPEEVSKLVKGADKKSTCETLQAKSVQALSKAVSKKP